MISIASPELGEREKARVEAVIDSGMLADGPEVRDFEDEFAAFCEAEHSVATSNGTTALHAAFEALGLGEGDRILTTPFSFIASANAIRFCGAEPVFADVDPATFNLDPHAVESRLRAGDGDIDAILAVHLYGLPADLSHLGELADEYDLLLIEDAAQAHGATIDGQPVGSFGDAACFSFYPTKNMTTGEGGMITTNREDVAARAAQFVNHGRSETYEHERLGHNFRMTSIAAAIGRVQLEILPEYTRARRENAARLTDGLADAPVTTPVEPDGTAHVYHQYTIRSPDRDRLQAHLEANGVGSGVYYPIPIHQQPAYEAVDATAPEAEQAADEVLSLPVHPALSADDLDTICRTVTTL